MEEEYKLIELDNDDETEIRYIYHMSDIHIQNIKKHKEYKQVFEKVYDKIRIKSKEKEKQSLIVLTGDIVHSKTELSPETINMTYHFFHELSQILPVIVIAGNHDCIVSNPNRLDALTPIISNSIGINNLHYLKTTGLYKYHNIIFGLTDIYTDTPLLSENITTEIFKEIKQKNKYKIALYHGPIRESKTDTGYEMKSVRFRAKDFRGYDYAFFGDIHKFQYLNKDKTMAYAGSLIQQSYGESLENHGILKWDLFKKTSKLIQIPNNYGYCIINVKKGKVINKNIYEIIPKNPKITLKLQDTSENQFQKIKENLEKKYNVIEIIKENKLSSTNNLLNSKDKILAEFDHKQFVKSYIKKKSPNKSMSKKIYKLHEHIYEKILNGNDNLYTSIGGKYWKILELKFSNIFSYGKNNIIDFRKYEQNQIIGIVAPNHYGKSAILDIILYCLFEKSSRGGATNIMNKNENKMECSLLFSISEREYLIERTAIRSKNDLRMTLEVNFSKTTKKKEQKFLNGYKKNDTNQNIINLIGTYDDYLTSYICTQEQEQHGNFMNKTNKQKKEYLYEILKLNIFDECFVFTKNKLQSYNNTLKNLEKEINNIPIKSVNNDINDLKEKMNIMKREKNHINELLKLIEISLNTFKIPTITKYNELSNYNLQTEKNIIDTIKLLKDKTNNTTEEITDKISKYQNIIKELKNNDFDRSLNILNDKLECLYPQIINIPTNNKITDIDTLNNEREILKINIDEINNALLKFKSKIKLSKNNSDKQIDQKQHDMLIRELQIKKLFAKHIKKTIKYLEKCDNNVTFVRELQIEWIDNYKKWKEDTKKVLNKEIYDLSDIMNKIELLETKKETHDNKLKIIDNQLNILQNYKKHIKTNEKIQKYINETKEEIKQIQIKKKGSKHKIKILKTKIEENKNLLSNNQKYQNHIKLLKEYNIIFDDYSIKKEKYQKIIKEKDDLNIKLNDTINRINNIKLNILNKQNIINGYDKLTKQQLTIEKKKKIYESYYQMINTNGIPYEILKTVLPCIESEVNQILHNMINFNIKFLFHNETDNKNNKIKQNKTTLNAIDIHLHYHNQKSYSANLASGFEKFIIGLAIRMVLCKISKSAKPNFFIIDEGWSCFDNENLSNVDTIMMYIKNQFEHVIIISHLEELKGQAKYIINIDKQQNHSYVNNTNINKINNMKIIEV